MGGFFFTLNDSAFFEEQLFDTTPSAENYVKLYFWVTMRWKPYFLLSLNNSCKTNITANSYPISFTTVSRQSFKGIVIPVHLDYDSLLGR